MKTKTANHRQLDILGNRDHSSDHQEIFNAVLKRWWQRLGYCSVFATVPAMVISQVQAARTDEAKQTESSVAGQRTKLLRRLSKNYSNRELLKRQSQFVLSHQKGSSDLLAPLGGNDDCPGQAIPGGNYTIAAPYVDTGNTSGANDTVTRLPNFYYYYYSSYSAEGPDHIYSFTLTGRGPNAQIEVSTASGTYKPLAYVLVSDWGPCPAGAGNRGSSPWVINDTRWRPGSSSTTLNITNLPLNVPMYLFVDSAHNDASGSGPYQIRMLDVTIAPPPAPNQIDDTQFFVRQHYRDFLNREADPEGLAFWMNEITSCGGDQQCIEVKRINDSASFFLSIEFQETGYLVYRMYKAAFGHLPNAPVPIKLDEFLPDTQRLGQGVIVRQGGWEQVLENNKRNFAQEFVQRARFTSAFLPSTSAAEFVDTLNRNAGNPLSPTERDQLVSDLSSGARSRADVLRAVAENRNLVRMEFNRAFVLMQYFGYLRRNPNDAPDGNFAGYNFWLDKLNQFNGDFKQAEMVKAFMSSTEYRRRFGS